MPIVDFNLREWGRASFEVDKNRFDAIGGAEALVTGAREFIGGNLADVETDVSSDLIENLLSRFALVENLRQDYTDYVAWYASIKPGVEPLIITGFNHSVNNRFKLLKKAEATIGSLLRIARNGKKQTPVTILDIKNNCFIKPSGKNGKQPYEDPVRYFSGQNFNRFRGVND